MVRHLLLTEGHPPWAVELSDAEAGALSDSELGVVTRRPGVSSWEVSAGNRVGVVRIGDLQVTVRPKIAMARLLFLVGYATSPDLWRDHEVELDADADLVDALAEAFQRQATRALEQGLLHGYWSVDEALPMLRGRVRVGDQIARRFGQLLPLEVRYDDFTVDIAENQLLLAATHRLLRLPSLSERARTALRRLTVQLADVSPLVKGDVLPTWRPTRLNVRYQAALRLADLVLAGDSFEQRVSDLRVTGFAFHMWKVYEDFVGTALGEALTAYGGRTSLQAHTHLDESRLVPMRPDLLWLRGATASAVVDAKYKAEKPSGFPQADLYQLLAYCTVLGLDHGHLVYARGNEEVASHRVVGTDVTIHCHTLDLALEPRLLLDEVDGLAAFIAAG